MLSDLLRARLAQLNREPLPRDLGSTILPGAQVRLDPAAGQLAPESLSRSDHLADCLSGDSPFPAIRTLRYLESGVEVENPAGRHLAIRLSWTHFGAELPEQLERVRQAWETHAAVAAEGPKTHREIAALAQAFPRDALFLDLETCGLGGAMVFLVGLLHWSNDNLILELLLARNYAEERAILTTLWQIAADKRLLVTFNGKSFDWPLVHDRSTLHRLGKRLASQAELEPCPPPVLLGPHDPRPELPHFDVLHHARRRWRQRLPNCRLQTLERYLCRRVRQDDVPGHQIPQAYHEFVRTGNARLLESILHHNALDLVTMTQVAMRMLYESSSVEATERAISSPTAAAGERIG